jgi:protease-4
MGDLAASGGYWISTYANRIFAEPNTITGSIGVFGLSFNVQKLANNQGITWDSVKTARYADSQTVVRPKSAQELAVNQRIVDQIYDRFLSKVAESRKIPKPRVNEIAQGRVWSGLEAKKIGLIDEIGGLESAIRDAAKRAQLGNDWELEEYPKTRSLEERILKKLVSTQISQSAKSTDPLTAQFQKFREDLAALGSLNDPLGVYARLPYNLQID